MSRLFVISLNDARRVPAIDGGCGDSPTACFFSLLGGQWPPFRVNRFQRSPGVIADAGENMLTDRGRNTGRPALWPRYRFWDGWNDRSEDGWGSRCRFIGGGCLRGGVAENECGQPLAENRPEKPWSGKGRRLHGWVSAEGTWRNASHGGLGRRNRRGSYRSSAGRKRAMRRPVERKSPFDPK